MLSLNTKIERLPSVGPTLKKTLNKLGIFYLEDFFYHLPFRYIDFSQKIAIGKAKVGELITLEGNITKVTARRSMNSRLAFTEAYLEDGTGQIKLMWFNQPYLAKQLKEGTRIVVAGKVEWFRQNQLTNPYFEIFSENQSATGKILPIYHLTAGITNLRLVKLLKLAWETTTKEFTELIPNQIQKKFGLMQLHQSLEMLHFPTEMKAIKKARLRIAIDDVLPQQIAAQMKQIALINRHAPKIPTDVEFIKKNLATLPFQLTNSQKRATWDILQDMASGKPMNRLLEGDVGSGKTVVALLSALTVAKAGFQTILIAPTEILAKQHHETFLALASETAQQTALLTSGFCRTGNLETSRTDLLHQLANGQIQFLIGTHAILSNKLDVAKLGLIIIDEQHRFGVGQRAFLGKKYSKDLIPHLLSMSATPIPRTLALSLFGNLQISQLRTLPANRTPIVTKLLSETSRTVAYKRIVEEISAGRQAFIITPKVEDSNSNTKSVKAEFARLQKLFPKLRLGLIYGGLNTADKDAVMNDFADHKLDILVATTVIEIGIDVPNATVMLIEGAENFGLAQLHQLRGRVGRSQYPSFCYLFTTDDAHLDTERLKIFEKNKDGFALAEYDLEQRGFGDLFGEEQSGFNFRYPKFITIEALHVARNIAQELLDTDPKLGHQPELKKLAHQYLETIHTE
ncbi:MAG TPA: ATP-dependent DNA helicase RecG [Candidatus Doudnabacteria bacterium]|nr:ATP-dependent DNA helicase RecG [Candidatus Doudnabacteria bacterium]